MTRALIIGVESTPPYPVTVLELTSAMLEQSGSSIVLRLSRLAVCEADQHFPSYTQTIVPFDVPPWMAGPEEEDDQGEGDEPGEAA